MGLSVIHEQRRILLKTIEEVTQKDWKVLVVDENARKLIDNIVKEDDILKRFIANIERIEERRDMNPTMDAVYLLSPQPHIVDCLLADLDRQRYRRAFVLWTANLSPSLRQRVESAPSARKMIAAIETLAIDYYPRESHVVTFRDPWSFPILYHPDCNNLVRPHMEILAQKIANICISLGEYPKVRYYRPKNPLHEASVLCTHLARFVQEQLDEYARQNRDFPPPSSRPPSILILTDRSMDLMAPLIHEFTYQAMAHDLLPIKEADKTTFHMVINDGTDTAEEKDMELHEKDSVWVENRHRHMKDTIDKLMGDFQKFLDKNPHFTNENANATSLNAIKDMMAGLPQFQEMKEAYSLHLTMAQECMNKFELQKLPDVASAEQTLATGLDEDYRKPRNALDPVVRLLDDAAVPPEDRLRLIMLYLLYRDGVIADDVRRLLSHAGLPTDHFETAVNLELLGGRPIHGLKEPRRPPADVAVFPLDAKALQQAAAGDEDGAYALSRFAPALAHLFDHLFRGQLDQLVFPYINPPTDPTAEDSLLGAGSLRAVKRNWADHNRRVADNRQRVFVFVAGGATFSEARACYEASAKHTRDIILITSHMLTPQLFLRQLRDLSANTRKLDIPLARPPPKAPDHLFQNEAPAPPAPPPLSGTPAGGRLPSRPQQGGGIGIPARPQPGGGKTSGPRPPIKQLGQMTLSSGSSRLDGSSSVSSKNSYDSQPPLPPSASSSGDGAGAGGKDGKLHKKRNIFGLKK